jgi:hypothetical protein
MKSKLLLFVPYFFFPFLLHAQIGGNGTYQFLNLTHSARVASLGSKTIAINDNDLDLAFLNPSLLTPYTSHNWTISYVNYFAGINYGETSYGFQVFGHSAAASIHYIDYGKFIASQSDGTITGSFRAADYVFQLSASHELDSSFRIGATVKPVYSVYETYTSFGLAADLAATYTSSDKLFCAAMVVRNAGTQIKAYRNGYYEALPFEILAGVSQQLKHAPLRFSLTLQQLQKPKLTYTVPDSVSGSGGTSSKGLSLVGENVMRHLIVGVELMPLKSFVIRAGYNYQRRKELAIADAPGMSGFSWGFGLNLRRFSISYGRMFYIPQQATDHFSLTVHLNQ